MTFSSVYRLFFILKLLSVSGASQLSLVEITGSRSAAYPPGDLTVALIANLLT
jgi:hypothetical protein